MERQGGDDGFAGAEIALVKLERDHPGFSDPVYRRRRDEIARLAIGYRAGDVPPSVDYTDAEHEVWRRVWRELGPMHLERACRVCLDGLESFGFDRERIPSFAEVNARLAAMGGFHLAPVAGLVEAGAFMVQLAHKRFLATQYVRHGSTPLYTPEPDVLHEYIGHVGSLAHPELGELNGAFGIAAQRVSAVDDVNRLIRAYWWTLEFGLVEQDGRPRALGAGLLSSFGELGRFDRFAELRPFDLDAMAATPFDPTDYQGTLFVAPSYATLRSELLAWLERV